MRREDWRKRQSHDREEEDEEEDASGSAGASVSRSFSALAISGAPPTCFQKQTEDDELLFIANAFLLIYFLFCISLHRFFFFNVSAELQAVLIFNVRLITF